MAHDEPLATLLADRLPRRQRCGTCRFFEEPDAEGYGDCAENVPFCSGCHANNGCVYWVPALDAWYDEWMVLKGVE
jgi:hypothetical protein